MKRARTDSLTGGTKDVNPQLMTSTLVLTAANAYTQVEIPTPISRYPTQRGRSMVMEILKVYFNLPEKDNNPAAAGEVSFAIAQLSTISQSSLNATEPRNIALAEKVFRGAFTAAGTYMAATFDPWVIDLTDGAGHGVLVATDSLFLGAQTGFFAGAATFVIKVLYRFKVVNVEEYIGIVQSQQG